jgi:sarcosine oxidase subunit gamma
MTSPSRFLRRSQLSRQHDSCGANYVDIAGHCFVANYGDSEGELRQLANLAIADLSMLPRIGFKGVDTSQWLRAHGYDLPAAPNLATRQADGSFIARLSNDEHLLISDLACTSPMIDSCSANWSLDIVERCYRLERADSHACLLVVGNKSPELFSKLCGVDLRADKFADGQVAQTSLARSNAIIVRLDIGAVNAFYVLCDVSVAPFLWMSVLDGMREFTVTPAVGIDALRKLAVGD